MRAHKILSSLLPHVLIGEAKIYKHSKADTLYLAIPSKVAQDSAFSFKKGDEVTIRFDPEKKAIIVESKKEEPKKRKTSN